MLQSNHCNAQRGTCPANNQGQHFLPLLQAGVKGWFIEAEPQFEALGANRTSEGIRSTLLMPDNASGGWQVGQEFCRVAAALAPAKLVVLYGSADAAHSTARIQNFIRGMNDTCPDAGHEIRYSFYADWSAEKAAAIMAPLLVRDGSIQAVVAANDDMAIGALVAAKQVRPRLPLLVAGYDASSAAMRLLTSNDMFATVDQNPPSGMVYTLQTLLSEKVNQQGRRNRENNVCATGLDASCSLDDYTHLQAAV